MSAACSEYIGATRETRLTQPMTFFDGHNDVLTRLFDLPVDSAVKAFVHGDGQGHIDLPRMRGGKMVGGLFALYVSPQSGEGLNFDELKGESYEVPLPPPLSVEQALPVVLRQAELLHRFAEQSSGRLKLCCSVADIKQTVETGAAAAVMHLEGAEAIDDELLNLDVLYKLGLRSLGPVWSRPTRFGSGVPFKFPGNPDIGPGLTSLGEALVARCNELRILIDLSHLNEKGFWDVARLSTAPLIATHSNVHNLCNSTRNLTDEQLQAIRDSDGMVGVNLATSFLREDGQMQSDTGIDMVLRHMDYLINILGEDKVGLGSDFDGAVVPDAIASVSGLSALSSAMQSHGYSQELMQKICRDNWINALQRVWGG